MVARLAGEATTAYKDPVEWDRALIETEFLQRFLLSVPGITDPAKIRHVDDLVRTAQEAAREAFRAKIEYMKDLETKLVGVTRLAEQALAQTTLGVIDEKWKDHLYDLDQLRAAIQYRAWGQKDPLIEYKSEAFEMFKGLMHDLETTLAERWLKLQVQVGPPPPAGRTMTGPLGGTPAPKPAKMVASKPAADGLIADSTATGPRPPSAPPGVPVAANNPYAGVGRNDPCPCGSGKKFKKCHGATV
ncbi:MAG: hypothetical protein DMD71_06365 [Gemmatimonadetes bacterium]|nr:MAG: hypothetical protein DMD71_06365 [Gemmatimonadota bacterium]